MNAAVIAHETEQIFVANLCGYEPDLYILDVRQILHVQGDFT